MLGAHRLYWIAGAVIAAAVSLLTAYWLGFREGDFTGKGRCELAHSDTQLKIIEKVHHVYEKIDHETPYTGDKSVRIKWLFENASDRH